MKVRHHYLPQCYLRGFCDQNEQIWTYKKNDPGNPFSNAISNTAVIKYLYSLSAEGNEDDLEDYFASDIEGPAAEALKKLIRREFPVHIEREKLAIFFSTLFTRTPVHIEHLNGQQSQQLNIFARLLASNEENFIAGYKESHPHLEGSVIEDDRQSILRGDFSFELNRDILLMLMLKAGAIYSNHLCNMRWVLLETNSDYPFVTSDNPLYIFHPNIQPGRLFQPGLGMRNTRVSIPISKELCLLLFNDERVADASFLSITSQGGKELIKSINKINYINSYKYVFASIDSKKLKTCFTKLLTAAQKIENEIQKD